MHEEAAKTVTFELGRVVVTRNCLTAIGDVIDQQRYKPHGVTAARESLDLLAMQLLQGPIARHHRGDWGDIATDDVGLNEQALEYGSRLLSVYDVRGVKVWVITDAASDACAACWTGVGRCEPELGEWHNGIHFRDDLPPRRLSTTVLLPEDY
jgi:hypothetical protein